MSKSVELIRIAQGTGFADRVRQFSLRVFGREVARYQIREVPSAVAGAARAPLTAPMLEILRALRLLSGQLYQRLALTHARILASVDQTTFARMVMLVVERGDRSFQGLRGLLVEHIMGTLPELDQLMVAMRKVRQATNQRLGERWGPPRFASNVLDGNARQLGDLLIVSVHPDGRVWVLAVLESKSVSNIEDLARLGNRPVGQHLWDYLRGRSTGLTIDGRYFKPAQVQLAPVPVTQWSGPAVVGTKPEATRLAEMTGAYTQFIGFVPRELTNGQVRNIAAQGIQVEIWRWPFDLADWDRLQRALTDELPALR